MRPILHHRLRRGGSEVQNEAHRRRERIETIPLTAKAKNEYADFLALWKDPDPGIPLMTQARVEYARLQQAKLPQSLAKAHSLCEGPRRGSRAREARIAARRASPGP